MNDGFYSAAAVVIMSYNGAQTLLHQ